MGNGDTAQRTRPKDRKQQILTVARDLFVEFGYHQVTMRLIADRLGIRAGALYRHYSNKAELIDAVVREGFAGLTPPSGEQTLDDTLAATAAVVTTRSYLGVLWSREARFLPAETSAMVRDLLRRYTRAYASLLRAQRPELSLAEAELLAWGLQSIMGSPGRYPARLSTSEQSDVLLGAARALSAVDLAPPGEPIDRIESRLQPVSRRERLLLGAMRLFADRGYQDTAMADIGAVADVTGPSLYAHFDNKGAVLLAVFERGTHVLWADLDQALRTHTEPWDALAAVVAGYVRRARDWSGLSVPMTGEPAIEETARAAQRDYVAEWVGLVEDGRPGLGHAVARALVHTAMFVVDDLCRTPHLLDGAFEANVSTMALAVLASAPEGG